MTMFKKDVTPEIEAEYWKIYLAAVDTMHEAMMRMASLEDAAADPGERSRYRSERLTLDANIELLRAKLLAFMAGSQSIQPPSQEALDKAAGLLKAVSELNANRQTASVIMNMAVQVMTIFHQMQR